MTLLNHNADPNIQEMNGKSCLFLAAELNSREHIVAFINHCKFPPEWDLRDNYSRKPIEASSSTEIRKLLSTYMKTSTAQRYSRETRMYNKLKNCAQANESNSRSRSKETGSLSKRTLKFGKNKSSDKSPITAHNKPYKAGTNNVVVHQARNESVKRMFRNFNRTKLKSIKKQVNLSSQNQDQSEPTDRSGQAKNYNDDNKEEIDQLLFNNTNSKDTKHPKLNSQGQIMVHETKGKKEPKSNFEMIRKTKSNSDNSDALNNRSTKQNKVSEYFESARRISVDEEPAEVIPKIQISLNQPFSKKSSHQTSKGKLNDMNKNKTQLLEEGKLLVKEKHKDHNLGMGDSKSMSLNHNSDEINVLIRHNFDDESIPNQLHSKNPMPHSSKNKQKPDTNAGFKEHTKLKAAESPYLSEKTLSNKKDKDKSQTYDNSDILRKRREKRASKKGSSLNDKHKNEIIKTISSKIKDSYLKNYHQGSYEHK